MLTLGTILEALLGTSTAAAFDMAYEAQSPKDDWREQVDAARRETPPLRTAGAFSEADVDHLRGAFRHAVDSLRRHDSCRELFTALGGQGERLLARSVYVRAKTHEESQICGRRVAAFTSLGSPVTRLCRNFRRLGTEKGALILLHEALHYAGQPEAPHEPDAPTSQELNDRVASSCGLGGR